MKLFNHYHSIGNRFLCLLFIMSVVNTGKAQNFSGLQNQTLPHIEDVGTVLTDLLHQKIDGDLNEIKVLYDHEQQLKIQVAFTGFSNAYLRAEVLDQDQTVQEEMAITKQSLENVTSPLELIISLKEDLKEGLQLTSSFLRFTISKSASNISGRQFLFALNKHWQTTINPENIVVRIRPEPIGSAQQLKEEQPSNFKHPTHTFKVASTPMVSPAVLQRARVMTYQPAPSPHIDGTWTNTDANTNGVTRLMISEQSSKIRLYGKCHPNDCDWGFQKLTAAGTTSYQATYDQGFVKRNLILSIHNNQLSLEIHNKYNDQRGTKTNQYTFTKKSNTTATTASTENIRLTPWGLKPIEEDKGALGPSNNYISLWEDLRTDVDFQHPLEISNIRMEIYPDKNPASGIFYYTPAAYYLNKKNNQYEFNIQYNATHGAGSGTVTMAGSLTPGISTREIDIIKTLLKSYPQYKFQALRPIPLEESPAISFPAALHSQYEIPEDKVNVNVTSSIIDPLFVSWVTDLTTKEEMILALENMGIKGQMRIKPSGDIPEQIIPVNITLGDPLSLGKIDLQKTQWRQEPWVNHSGFPLLLNYLHMLVVVEENNQQIPLIYSWDLNGSEVLPTSSVAFETTHIPTWLDSESKTKRIWLDYSVKPCESCNEDIIQNMEDAVVDYSAKSITFESFQILEKTGASFIQLTMRSKQGHPKHNELVEFTALRMNKDNEIFSVGPLYVPKGEKPSYEYFLRLVMQDGHYYESAEWIPGDELEVFMGMQSLKETIPSLPDEEAVANTEPE